MQHRRLIVLIVSGALVLFAAAAARAQCVPMVSVEDGHFDGGWITDHITTTIDGNAVALEGEYLPGPPPVPHGWSDHNVESFRWVLGGTNTLDETRHYIGTVDTRTTGLTGDRRDMPPGEIIRFYYDYMGEGTISNGTGQFAGITGHTRTRGPFWIDLINIPGVGVLPANFVAPNAGSGQYAFETRGMLCGAGLK